MQVPGFDGPDELDGPDGLEGLGVPGEPSQVTPLRAKVVGAGLLPVQAPLKPKEAVPPVAIVAL
ncbi:hypothetical protein GCM10009557_71730 [Virgisporangium ochraceum]